MLLSQRDHSRYNRNGIEIHHTSSHHYIPYTYGCGNTRKTPRFEPRYLLRVARTHAPFAIKWAIDHLLNSSVICGPKLSSDECYALMEIDTENDRLKKLGEIEQRIRDIKNDLH